MYCYLIVKKLVLLFILISDALDKWDNFGVFRDAGSNNLSVKVKEVMKIRN